MFIKKCNNTSGASIFIALLFFLMCSVAGSVVLTAASTSSERLVSLKKDEQSYYSVVSAAKLLKKEIEGEKYSRYQVKSKSGDLITEGYTEEPSKGMQEFVKKAADEVFRSSDTFSATYRDSWIIKVSDSSIEEVTAQFSMDKKYNISIQLFQGNRHYTLRVPALLSKREEVINNVDSEKVQKKEITTVIWTEGEIRKN